MYAGVLETHEIGTTDEPKEDELGVRSTLFTVAFVTVNFKQVFLSPVKILLNTSLTIPVSCVQRMPLFHIKHFHLAYLRKWEYTPPQRLRF